MNKMILALAFVVSWGLTPLGAQETARVRAREALPAEVFQGIDALAARLGPEGIPQDPLFSKALEGMAKHVPSDRLLPAVLAYSNRLRESRGSFGMGASDPLILAGADALQRGVESGALRRLGGVEGAGPAGGGGPTPMAVLVLADLVESGVPADRALELLEEALRQRTREHEMLGLNRRVRGFMRQGQSPQQAAEQVRRMLQRGRGGGMGPPLPPGSEPSTSGRQKGGKGRGRGGGG